MEERIWLSSPHIGKAERRFVEEAFATNWVAPLGPNVDGFEKDISAYTGVSNCAALSSGTAAIHLALLLLDIGKGDVVLCQSLTFSASVNPVLYTGATPVFIDSETETWNMDPFFLEEAIKDGISKGNKPKAIIPVHLYGMPAKMDKIMSIAAAYGIPVIEDAAEALGSMHNDKKCGSFGLFGVLSFNGNKIITTSGGGALLSEDETKIGRAKFLATQARDPAPHYQHSVIGYNYRLSNVLAGIGRGQMLLLDERVRKRRENYLVYKTAFENIPGISFQPEPVECHSNRWLTCILINPSQTGGVTCEDIRIYLEEKNIEARPLWKPMHLQPVFKKTGYFGKQVGEKLFETGLCLPSGSNLSTGQLERVVTEIKKRLVM